MERLRFCEEMLVDRAFRPRRKPFVRQRERYSAEARAKCCLRERPLDEVALRSAATHTPEIGLNWQQAINRIRILPPDEMRERLDDRDSDVPGTWGQALRRPPPRLPCRTEVFRTPACRRHEAP